MATTGTAFRHGGTPSQRVWPRVAVVDSEQFAFWNEAVREVFGPVAVAKESSDRFRAEITQVNIGDLTIASVVAEPQKAERALSMAERDSTDRVYLTIPRSSQGRGQEDAGELIPRGWSLGVVSNQTPPETRAASEFSHYVVGLPAELVSPRLADSASTEIAEGALPALLSQITDYLFHHATEFNARDAHHVMHHVADLIVASCGPSNARASGHGFALLQAAMDHAELMLNHASLGTDTLASYVNVSRRTLEKLFAERGTTTARWILQRRLEHARNDLMSAEHDVSSIETIAQRWGFVDRTHFSRVFKAQFGESPAAFRRARSQRVLR